jgi:TrmH family RNA methyltransferase
LAAGAVVEVFATAEAFDRYPELTRAAAEISAKDAAALSETVTPQGLIAVCTLPTTSVEDVLAADPRLVAVLVDPNDPGNLGTIVRTADAAGADAVIVVGGVDPHNGKAVRASAGSLFHLPVVECRELPELPGLRVLATTGGGERDLDDLEDDRSLVAPTAWLFGSEAHGLPDQALAAADATVRVPIHGRAESLNLATAAAVCVYATARVQRGG